LPDLVGAVSGVDLVGAEARTDVIVAVPGEQAVAFPVEIVGIAAVARQAARRNRRHPGGDAGPGDRVLAVRSVELRHDVPRSRAVPRPEAASMKLRAQDCREGFPVCTHAGSRTSKPQAGFSTEGGEERML